MAKRRLGVGFIGSGFNTRFHMQAWQGVRDADILGVWSPNQANAASAAALARRLDVGRARAFPSIAAMVADPAIDAIWLCGPNHARIENVEEITDTIIRGRGELIGLACEKPLARTVKEAKQVAALARQARLQTGYLENQLFSPQVEYGRSLYDNLMKYLRFQMASLVAFIAVFLAATIFNIANGTPLDPLQILWLNMVVDIPIAIALGFDQATKGLMERPPRPVAAPVLSRANWIRLCVQGAIMTIGSLVAYQVGDDMDGAVVGATMLLTTLSIFHVVAGLMSRDQVGTVFDRDAMPGVAQLRRYGIAVLAIVAITTIDLLERIFGTTEMDGQQWGICIALAASLLVVEEAIKFFLRRRSTSVSGVLPGPPVAPALAV